MKPTLYWNLVESTKRDALF